MTQCCVEVPTLQSVYDSETAVYDEDVGEVPRDLVAEAVTLTDGLYGDFADSVAARIWNDYRYRMLGTCDEDMFVRILADRLSAEAYTAVMGMQAVAEASELGTLLGGKRTVVRGSREDSVDTEGEEFPDNFSAAYTYPSDRSKTTQNYGEQTDTETDYRSGPQLIRETLDALKDPLDDLMRNISGCWLNMW